VTVALRGKRGARIRAIAAYSGGRRVALRRGRALRVIRLAGLRPGVRPVVLRVSSTSGAYRYGLRRTVRCA